MNSASLDVATEWAGQLAQLAETLLEKVPDKEEFTNIRGILQDTSGLLRQGNVGKGVRRLLPYVGKVLTHVDKYMHVSDSYSLAEAVHDHFLVDEQVQKHLEQCMATAKGKMVIMKASIENFGRQVDDLLDKLIHGKGTAGVWTFVKLTIYINRLSSLISTCEYEVNLIGHMIDDVDTHVASKRLLADVFTVGSFVGGTVLSMLGNVPAGAACLVSATASRKSAKSLDKYRTQLRTLDHDHQKLHTELAEWKNRFQAEQNNFMLLLTIQFSLFIGVLLIGLALIISRDCCYGVFVLSCFYWFYMSRGAEPYRLIGCCAIMIAATGGVGWLYSGYYEHLSMPTLLTMINSATLLFASSTVSPKLLS